MIGFHFQNTTHDWPRAVAALPPGTPVKAVDRGDILREAKQVNPGVLTILRHWYDHGQHFDGASYPVLLDRARTFFATFIDGTFAQQYAPFVDVVETWNETLANSQTQQERQWRIDQCRAFCEVWAADYRPQYPHIRLCLANAAVGNDIPEEMAALAIQYSHYLGYHPYTGWASGTRWANDWVDLSGRWATMEAGWIRKPYWLFTEGGPFESAVTGWRSPECLGGSRSLYVLAMREWLEDVLTTPAYQQGRVAGLVLFTTGGGAHWPGFETGQPEMDQLAALAQEFPPGAPPEPPPPPEPGLINLHETTANVNMRHTPNTEHTPIIVLPQGTRVQVEGEAGDWRKVTAWVHGAYLQPVQEPPGEPLLGIDVSEWQGDMNWQQAANAGVQRAIIKASSGNGYTDPRWNENRAGAHAAAIPFGAYHFWNNRASVANQVQTFLNAVGDDMGPLGPVLDVEMTENMPADIATRVRAWLTSVENITGRTPMIYTSAAWWNTYIGAVPWANDYPLWIASWGANDGNLPPSPPFPILPGAWTDWTVWQYTSYGNGSQFGASSPRIDLNLFRI